MGAQATPNPIFLPWVSREITGCRPRATPDHPFLHWWKGLRAAPRSRACSLSCTRQALARGISEEAFGVQEIRCFLKDVALVAEVWFLNPTSSLLEKGYLESNS